MALAAMVACLASSQARAPGAPLGEAVAAETQRAQAPQPVARLPATLGAADLFAALTEPDRSSEIDALRAIRRVLADADSPQARDAARDQVDSLLDLEERRQPDVPPALVMSSLAARIDGAIASLEQTARAAPAAASSGGAVVGPDLLASPLLMAALATLVSAVAIGAATGTALVGRRRLAMAMTEAREDFLAATQRLDRAGAAVQQAQALAAPGMEEAAGAVRDATLAAARLTGAAMEMDVRLRDCIDVAAARQGQAAEVTAECETFIRNLPALLAGAVEMIEARGLPVLEKATVTLQDSAASIAESLNEWPTLAEALKESTQAAAGQAQGLHEPLQKAIELAGVLPGIAGSLAASAASLGQDIQNRALAETQDRAAADADAADAAVHREAAKTQAAALGEAVNSMGGFVALLPDITASLAAAAAQLRRDGQMSGQNLTQAAAALSDAAGAAREAAEGQQTCLDRLQTAASVHEDLAAKLPVAIAALSHGAAMLQTDLAAVEAATQTQAGHGAQTLRQIDEAAGGLPRAAAALEQVAAAVGAQLVALANHLRDESQTRCGAETARTQALESLFVRTEATLATLPGDIDQLARLGGALPAAVAALTDIGVVLRDNASAVAEAAGEQTRTCCEVGQILGAATADWPHAAAALRDSACIITGQLGAAAETVQSAATLFAQTGAAYETRLAALAARAEAAVGVLPAEADQFAAVAATLRHEAAVLAEAGATVARSACSVVTLSPRIVDKLEIMYAGFAESQAGLDAMSLNFRQGAALLQQEALECVAASRGSGEELAVAARAATAQIDQAARSASASEADRIAAGGLQTSLMTIAARMEALVAEGERSAARVKAGVDAQLGASGYGDVELTTLRAALTDTIAAADRLAKQSEAHAAAAERVVHQALSLAGPATPQTGLACLASVNGQTRALLAAAGHMAELALRGEAGSLPHQVVAETPALLAAIAASIDDLRGAATALAIASDTALLAA